MKRTPNGGRDSGAARERGAAGVTGGPGARDRVRVIKGPRRHGNLTQLPLRMRVRKMEKSASKMVRDFENGDQCERMRRISGRTNRKI